MNGRQRGLLAEAVRNLEFGLRTEDILLQAEGVRTALGDLDRITGASDTEAMLDVLFGKFCIGK